MSKKKLIAIVLIIILIGVCIFLINLGRKVIILSRYADKSNEYSKITNFYRKSNPEEGVITELWRKCDLGLLKRTSKDDVKMINYGKDYNWIIVDGKDSKTAVKMIKEGIGIEAQTLPTGTLYMENLWDKIKMAFSSKITTENLNGIECYKIEVNKEWQIFINKDNLLYIREINGSTDTGIIEYKMNEVRDEDVTMPNLAGYTINDTTESNKVKTENNGNISTQRQVTDSETSTEKQVTDTETSIKRQGTESEASKKGDSYASTKKQGEEEKIEMIKIKVNNNVLEVKLEDNEATKSLVKKLKNGNITVNANEYGGFEKVGDLGFSLPRNDKNITTSAGDIVLYQGNQISLFYNSNSWSYTKLGKVQNVSAKDLKNILGSGDVSLVLSLE